MVLRKKASSSDNSFCKVFLVEFIFQAGYSAVSALLSLVDEAATDASCNEEGVIGITGRQVGEPYP